MDRLLSAEERTALQHRIPQRDDLEAYAEEVGLRKIGEGVYSRRHVGDPYEPREEGDDD